MRTSKFSPEQIAQALRQAESGTPIVEICRKLQVTEKTFYRWKKKFGELGTPEVREIRQLREENRKLKQLVADLSLDKTILQDSLRKKGEPSAAADVGALGARGVCGLRAHGVRRRGRRALERALYERGGAAGAAPTAFARIGPDARGLRVSAPARAPVPRRLAGEPQARTPAIPGRRVDAAA
jgi:putative transposase